MPLPHLAAASTAALIAAVVTPAAAQPTVAAPDAGPARTTAAPAALPPAGSPNTPPYRSAFEGYRAYEDEAVQPWRTANDRVGSIGGWSAYAREAAAAARQRDEAAAAVQQRDEAAAAVQQRDEAAAAVRPRDEAAKRAWQGEAATGARAATGPRQGDAAARAPAPVFNGPDGAPPATPRGSHHGHGR